MKKLHTMITEDQMYEMAKTFKSKTFTADDIWKAMMKKNIFSLWFSLWRKRRIHMVVTHAPPRHIHDKEDLCHMGFDCFNRLIKKKQPEYFIHGHVHQDFQNHADRITQVNTTRVINTCGYTLIEV